MKIIVDSAIKYTGFGLSVIPAKADKSPDIVGWKQYQETIMPLSEVSNHFYNSPAIAIICGKVSGNLEVIDIDCKYDTTGTLAKDFFEMVKDNMNGTFEQLVIIETKNKGWHIYYKCNSIGGNVKLANRQTTDGEKDEIYNNEVKKGATKDEAKRRAKNDKERVLIETRGEGGYVIAPPSNGYTIKKGDIGNIPEITIEDREILLSIARSFDETHQEPFETSNTKDDPFDEYNRRGDVLNLLESHGWATVKQSGDRVHLKRPGNTQSKVSGNWHMVKRIFYPFTSSTQFEPQKGYNAAGVFILLDCNGDKSEAARKLIEMGFGSKRVNHKQKSQPITEKIPLLPIDGFPVEIRELITTCSEIYGTHRDFFAGALIAAIALAIGDKLELIGKYKNIPLLWINLIGDVSSGKTEAMNFMLSPFRKLDTEAFKKHELLLKDYERQKDLSKKERIDEGISEIVKPEYFQYLLNDFTPEAMADAHRINSRGLMIERDELKGWIDDFGRYNKSGEQSNMLSSFNRVPIKYNRKSGIIYIHNPNIPVFGGMQPDLLPTLAADNRAENGFLARFGNVFPDNTKKPMYSDKIVPPELINQWMNFANNLIGLPETKMKLSPEAGKLYQEWFNKNANEINKTDSQHLKGVFGKLDIISLRLAIVVKGMKIIYEAEADELILNEAMKTALLITEYFRSTAIKVYNRIANTNHKETKLQKSDVIRWIVSNTNKKENEIATFLETSRSQVHRLKN